MPENGISRTPSPIIVTSSGVYEAIVDIQDPRGIRIYCEKRNWEEHVIARKPSMIGTESEVKDALEHPTAVLKDANFDDRECYYQLKGRRYLKVVVRKISSTESAVITAFFADSPKRKETLIWKS